MLRTTPHTTGPETARLVHQALTANDAPAFFALNIHPEVMRYTGEPPMCSLDEARRAIAEYPDFDTVGFGRWGCFLKTSKALIGFCGLKRLPELGGEVDIGYRFLPDYWGRGLATEACAACLAFGFDTLRLPRIIALVLPDNAASIRVLEKVGMRPDGVVQVDGLRALRYATHRAGA